MQCPNCSHENVGGKFCVKCGTQLDAGVQAEQAATVESVQPTVTQPPVQPQVQSAQPVQPAQPQQPNQALEATKKISKLYFAYFMQGLKSPTNMAQNVKGDQFINGIITMILYAISIPLMVYLGLRGSVFSPSFTDAALKPGFYYLLFIGFVALVTFGVVKLGRVEASIQDVFARFGAFLIVPTLFLITALVLSILKIELFMLLLSFGFIGLFLVIPFTIYSFKRNTVGGLDGVYATFLTYLAIILFFTTVAKVIINQITDIIGFGLF
ncbi:zinc ribbon domain-containing protein [Ferdinandcohnia quinoae]|uniref:Zinc ribbon domain-containing protein n=1 Tax=Fredinandcohnia quinoae TaxID=2918902 RepID=A0AAW5E4H1_9BACI|nr:zinc ribbon domain-containing protein [Fredinandcohnia sp. SECRCQ15]MCH1627840.1 zinc ribbon domain-containing protein [Fredinandcohnia sp. SECRCQ15]